MKLFTHPARAIGLARNLGLVAVDVLPGAKAQLARQAMGLSGRLPRLLRGAGLNEALIVIFITLLAFPFALAGLVTAQALVWLYQLVELVIYGIRRLFKWVFRRDAPAEDAPTPTVYYRAA